MREILFRGKATNRDPNRSYRTKYKNGDWVYGLLTDVENYAGFSEMTNINGVSGIEVDKNTVGQFTGLTDKNGEKIFEGDIVDILTENEEIGVVKWDDGGFIVSADGFCVDFQHNINGTDVEIIGNIHDNPELLGGDGNG